MKKILTFAFLILMPLIVSGGEKTYNGSRSIAESRKNKLLIEEYDTTNLFLKSPDGWVQINEAWLEKATIAGGLFRKYKVVNGSRLIIIPERMDPDIGHLVYHPDGLAEREIPLGMVYYTHAKYKKYSRHELTLREMPKQWFLERGTPIQYIRSEFEWRERLEWRNRDLPTYPIEISQYGERQPGERPSIVHTLKLTRKE